MSEPPLPSEVCDEASAQRDAREVGRYTARRTDSRVRSALVIIVGVHGNEPAGGLAAERVLETLEREQPSGFDGQLIALRGNLAAINHPDPDHPNPDKPDPGQPEVRHRAERPRYITHDLNRLFTDAQIAMPASTSPEHEQMQELLAELRSIRAQCDQMVVVDLHTTSSNMAPVVILEDSIPTRRMARHMPLPIYLGFEEELHGLLIDRTTSELGAVSILVEGGQHQDPNAVSVHEAVIWEMLEASGVLGLGDLRHEVDPRQVLHHAAGDDRGAVYDIRFRHEVRFPDFAMSAGAITGRKIKRNATIIASEGSIGVTSPVRGRVFMPNMQTHKRPGDDGFFIVRRVGEGWLGLSARLRQQRWLHGLIAHLPGVYPFDDRTLCVDADLAAVLRRQILHLLGYRLVRHDQRDGGRGLGRVYKGAVAFIRALVRGPIPGGPDLQDPRFWLVRRHALDM